MKRIFFGGLLILSAGLRSVMADVTQWPFKVYLDDQLVGDHRFTLKGQGDRRILESVAKFDVRFLGIGFYHYDHVSNESWKRNCLESIRAQTDDNGTRVSLQGTASPESFSLIVDGATHTLPGCIMTFAYWNPDMLQQKQLLNPQTGELTSVSIRPLGRETMTVGIDKRSVDHYLLVSPQFEIDLWYDLNGQWVALDSRLENNKKLRYRLDQPS